MFASDQGDDVMRGFIGLGCLAALPFTEIAAPSYPWHVDGTATLVAELPADRRDYVALFYEIRRVFPEYDDLGDFDFAVRVRKRLKDTSSDVVAQDKVFTAISNRVAAFRALSRADQILLLDRTFDEAAKHLSPVPSPQPRQQAPADRSPGRGA
jgi:hypothetical protein